MNRAVIVSALRTPIGNMGGSLKDVSAVKLGADIVKESMDRIKLNPQCIDEVIIGNVLGAGLGQNVSRQIAIAAGIPESVTAYTVNKVCGSGMKAVTLAASMIQLGEGDIYIAGGTENMSQVPYALNQYRWGGRIDRKSVV